MPNPVKPVQDYLTGWHTEVVRGHAVIVGDSLSPWLNHLNTHADRQFVIGEKASTRHRPVRTSNDQASSE